MSGSIPNPFFTSPGIGQSVTSLARLFAPDPDSEYRAARVALTDAQIEGVNLENKARGRGINDVAAQQEALRRGPGTDSAAWFRDILAAASSDPQRLRALAQGAGVLAATQGLPESELARIVVGAGGNWGNTESGTRFQVDTQAGTVRRGQDIGSGDNRYRTDADERARRFQIEQEQQGLDRRYSVAPPPGGTVVVPPNSPLAPRATPEGVITGPPRPQEPLNRGQMEADQARRWIDEAPTPEERERRRQQFIAGRFGPEAPRGLDEVRAREAQEYINSAPTPEERERRRREVIAGRFEGLNPPGGARPPEVGGGDINAINGQIAVQLPENTSLNGAGAAWVRNRAAALMQQQGATFNNVPQAVAAALTEFFAQNPPGQRSDNRLNPFSSETREYGAPAPPRNATPARPPGVPPGSAYSPSRRMWRAPDGTMFMEDGRPAA
jgi:hypothetical protein